MYQQQAGDGLPSVPGPPDLTRQLFIGQQGLVVKDVALEP